VLVQTEQLHALGVDPNRTYIDRGFSGTTRTNQAGLDQVLAAAWDGSVFTATKFDRFARNIAEANEILTDLGASVYDWNDPFGRLFLQTFAMVAEFEANLNHARTREGMAIAKRNGKLKGKQPQAARVRAAVHPPPLHRRRGVPGRNLAEEYSVGHSTIHRVIHRNPITNA
jgi:DNA invertase Pin-like site-specific DNA recombinase